MGDQVLVGALVGVLVAVAGAIANFVLARRRDRAQWSREEDVERRHWEREDRLRDYQERRLAYKALLRFADLMHGQERERWEQTTGRPFYDEYRDAVNDVRLIAPPIVWDAADTLETLARHGVGNAEYGLAKNTFIALAREDLGKPQEAPYPVSSAGEYTADAGKVGGG